MMAAFDKADLCGFNAYVVRNQHRWKKSLGQEILHILEEATETIAWAWETDQKYPKSYPMNTDHVLFEVRHQIKTSLRPSDQKTRQKRSRLPNPKLSPPAQSFADLISEKIVKAVYEDQNAHSYKEALRRAEHGNPRIFRKILNAMETAFEIERHGDQAAPPPRIHFLHKNLFEIAYLVGLGDMSDEGMVEFLEDLCPCGKQHRPDALRKFRKRWTRMFRYRG